MCPRNIFYPSNIFLVASHWLWGFHGNKLVSHWETHESCVNVWFLLSHESLVALLSMETKLKSFLLSSVGRFTFSSHVEDLTTLAPFWPLFFVLLVVLLHLYFYIWDSHKPFSILGIATVWIEQLIMSNWFYDYILTFFLSFLWCPQVPLSCCQPVITNKD